LLIYEDFLHLIVPVAVDDESKDIKPRVQKIMHYLIAADSELEEH